MGWSKCKCFPESFLKFSGRFWDSFPLGNSHLGQLPPDNPYLGQLTASYQGQLPPGNCPQDSSPGQFPTRTTVLPPDNCTPTIKAQSNDNYEFQFFVSFPYPNYIITVIATKTIMTIVIKHGV